jgi:hypothetical protein
MKARVLVVPCKTPGCTTDLSLQKTLPAFDSSQAYKVLVKTILPHPGQLLCPTCGQIHEYVNEEITERLQDL